jgi:hypothetical protein
MANGKQKTLIELLEDVAEALQHEAISFAVCGGLAASFYRKRPRLTNDVDLAISGQPTEQLKAIACSLLESLKLKASFGWIAGSEKTLNSPVALVIGQSSADNFDGTVDLLLPVFPWIDQAVKRGQMNLIDYGFAQLPTATPEDLILAKAFALSINPDRYTDLDDIQSICCSKTELDLLYLATEFEQLNLTLPSSLDKVLPNALRRAVKIARRK